MIGVLFVLLFVAIVVALLAILEGLRAVRRLDDVESAGWRWEPNTGVTGGVTLHLRPVTSSTAGRRP